jgi:UDP-N-acetylmuramoylalanine--D-glutamate ligase
MNPVYERFVRDFKDKHILIMGLGVLGRGIADTRFFSEMGCSVTVTDLKTEQELADSLHQLKEFPLIRYVLGKHDEQDFKRADVVIKNAGVHRNSPYLRIAQEHGAEIYMDEALFALYSPSTLVGITGTRGKTTTTTLIGKFLEAGNIPILMGGNLQGKATLPLLKDATENHIVILELSSWQLQGFGDIQRSPHIAVYTNLYPDHLNYYNSMESYDADKRLIYLFQKPTDYLLVNKSQPKASEWAAEAPSQVIFFDSYDVPDDANIQLLGEHNRENIAAALGVAALFNISQEQCLHVLECFEGVEHRMETVSIVNGIQFINDTTATTPIAAIKAIRSLKQPIHLIAGGSDKKLDLTPFVTEILTNPYVKSIYLLTGTGTDIMEAIMKTQENEKIYRRFQSLKDACEAAYKNAQNNEVILLSPGCASFGLFVNEFDRGNQFKHIVHVLDQSS